MGWTNFIVIPKLRLIIETSRHLDDLHDYRKEVLDYFSDEDNTPDEDISIGDISVKKLSVSNLTLLYNIYEKSDKLFGIYTDEFILYWLKSRNIKYEIISEHNIDLELYEKDEYTILRMSED